MEKRTPEHLSGRETEDQKIRPSKTPAGVWVIVGLAVFFVIGGLGISAFIVVKAISINKGSAAPNDAPIASIAPARNATAKENESVGVDHPKPAPEAVVSVSPSPDNGSAEEESTRREVLVRIDLMRSLTNNEKDKLYAQVERAQGFKKIAVIPFTEKSVAAGATQIDVLIKDLREPAMQALLSDPTVAVIIVGYADKRGGEATNLEISRNRAENVVKALKDKMDLANVVHAVAMGGQDLFDKTDTKKNCVVEVWAAEP